MRLAETAFAAYEKSEPGSVWEAGITTLYLPHFMTREGYNVSVRRDEVGDAVPLATYYLHIEAINGMDNGWPEYTKIEPWYCDVEGSIEYCDKGLYTDNEARERADREVLEIFRQVTEAMERQYGANTNRVSV